MAEKEPKFITLNTEEFKALGNCSGSALRLYIALSAFAWKGKYTCYPKWSQITKIMGKDVATSNLKRAAKELEKAGLLKRGEFGSKQRFILLLKKKLVKEHFNDDEGVSETSPEGIKTIPSDGIKIIPTPYQNDTEGVSNSSPVKKEVKSKLKSKNKDTSSYEKKGTAGLKFKVLPEAKHERWKLLQKIEVEGQSRWLHEYDPFDIGEWAEELERNHPQGFPRSKEAMLKFIKNWDHKDYL